MLLQRNDVRKKIELNFGGNVVGKYNLRLVEMSEQYNVTDHQAPVVTLRE